LKNEFFRIGSKSAGGTYLLGKGNVRPSPNTKDIMGQGTSAALESITLSGGFHHRRNRNHSASAGRCGIDNRTSGSKTW